jgi:PAT family beta-lactamase induction signal transducer AmpG
LVSIASATHDIAADGLYIASLSNKQQAEYAGWQGAFFNAARILSSGGLLILAGYLEKRMAVENAWTIIFALPCILMIALGLYHTWALPSTKNDLKTGSMSSVYLTLWDVIKDFFKKPGIWMAILFIVLFRAGEGQIQAVGPLFLRDPRSVGGLGLATDQVGVVYGTVGTFAFLVGSILGGYFTSWLGLRRALPYLIIAMNLPNLAFFFLSTQLPSNLFVIALGMGTEMFGYGFGYVGMILFIMQVVAVGKYQTAHYALGTGVMQLGFVFFQMISGRIQLMLGYKTFFIWVLISAIPALLLSRFISVPKDEKVKSNEANSMATAEV